MRVSLITADLALGSEFFALRAALFSLAGQLGPVLGPNLHVLIPPRVGAPTIAEPGDAAWSLGLLQQFDGRRHDLPLHIGFIGFAAGVTEGEIGEHEPGYTAVFYYIQRRADDHGGNSVRFQVTCYQTHGLVTHGSQRHEQRDIDAVFAAPFQ